MYPWYSRKKEKKTGRKTPALMVTYLLWWREKERKGNKPVSINRKERKGFTAASSPGKKEKRGKRKRGRVHPSFAASGEEQRPEMFEGKERRGE